MMISITKKEIELAGNSAVYPLQETLRQPDSHGYYGKFGGAYIPEMLQRNVEELKARYIDIMYEPSFQEEFTLLLKDYVGRPTPLFLAERLSREFNTSIYLKREDLCHTGAHKINNTIGQILLARKLGKTRIIAETGAGQHGVATATVCALKGMECIVYMGEKDIERQAPNVGADEKCWEPKWFLLSAAAKH